MTTTDTLLTDLADVLDRASRLATEMAATLAACPMHEPGDPDCRPSHGGACRPPVDMLAVDLGTPTGFHLAVATMPVADVPVDGSVEVRPVGRFGPWVHVIGEALHAVGGGENRSLLIDGITEPFTWHRDQCVQVRPFRPTDEDLADAMHRAQTGGL